MEFAVGTKEMSVNCRLVRWDCRPGLVEREMVAVIVEIADKMPGAFWPIFYSLPFAGAALVLGILRWPLVLLSLPLIAFGNFVMWFELQEPVFGDCIIAEMGWGYIWSEFIGWNAPFVVAFVVVAAVRLYVKRNHPPPGSPI